jgi:hypothetical protein
MSVMTATDLTEIELLHFYLGMRISHGDKSLTIEQALQDYAEYRIELDEFRATLSKAEESSARGLAAPVDRDELKREVRERLISKGVAT